MREKHFTQKRVCLVVHLACRGRGQCFCLLAPRFPVAAGPAFPAFARLVPGAGPMLPGAALTLPSGGLALLGTGLLRFLLAFGSASLGAWFCIR